MAGLFPFKCFPPNFFYSIKLNGTLIDTLVASDSVMYGQFALQHREHCVLNLIRNHGVDLVPIAIVRRVYYPAKDSC